MGVNKVICNDEIIMDITSSTVTEDTLLEGVMAFNASGDKITGKYVATEDTFSAWLSDPVNNSLIIPNGIVTVEDDMFRGAWGVRSVVFPDSLETISQRAFRDCVKLTGTLDLKNVAQLEGEAFRGCTAVTGLSMNAMEDIGSLAFAYMTGLTTITLPGTTNAIRTGAFSNCTNLTTITFVQGEKSNPTGTMAKDIIANCPALTDIYVYWASTTVINAPWGAQEGVKIHYTDKTMQVQADGTLAEVTE